MRRIVSVWLPEWPLDRLKRSSPEAVPDNRPFALVLSAAEAGGRGQLVHAANSAARRAGLASGLSLADARAAVPDLVTRPAEIVRDRISLRRLALWAGRYGPRRHVDGDDGLWIDVTGVAHLFGGEVAMMSDLLARLDQAGIGARAGLADTLGAAYALARYAPREPTSPRFVIAPPAAGAALLAPLPVEALRISPETVVLLKRLGLRRIGQLYDMPRSAIEQRFRDMETKTKVGARRADDASRALLVRLDAALGKSAEPRRPIVEPPEHRVQRLFAEPLISHDGLLAAVDEVLASLVATLAERELGLRRIRLLLCRADGSTATAAAGTSAPTQDDRHLRDLLAGPLAAIDAGFGIDALIAEAVRTEPLQAVTRSLAAGLAHGARHDPAPFFDRLAARFGAERAHRLVPVESHWPERSEQRVPVLTAAATDRPWPAPCARAARPPLLLAMPEPIVVVAEVPDGPPMRFTWRRVGHRVIRAEGPERIAPEWWRSFSGLADRAEAAAQPPLPRPRDYYRVEDDQGGCFWVFREGLFDREATQPPPSWYLQGMFG